MAALAAVSVIAQATPALAGDALALRGIAHEEPQGRIAQALPFDRDHAKAAGARRAAQRSGYGDGGTLVIPSAPVVVPLWQTTYDDNLITAQWVVDQPHEAAMSTDESFVRRIVADHAFQGFGNVYHLEPGTRAYVVGPTTTTEYALVLRDPDGTNVRTDVLLGDGTSLQFDRAGEWPLSLYTCNPGGDRSVTICLFEEVGTWDV